MKSKQSLKRVVILGALGVVLIGVLAIYSSVATNLTSQIYSPEQMEFLSRNYLKSVHQMAPILNAVGAEDLVEGLVEALVIPWKISHVQAHLSAHHEEFEGVSATVYDLEFHGEYQLGTPDSTFTAVELYFPFPDNLETLHEVEFLVDGEEPLGVDYSTQGIRWSTQLFAGEEHQVSISYHADGANTFTYALPQEQRSDLEISIFVSGLTGSTIPKSSLPPTQTESIENGEVITWDYTNLIADRDIQITLPAQLSFAQRVAKLQDDFRGLATIAPFLVGFSLLSLAGVFHLSGLRLRLESYLLMGCGVALFYPLLTFLSGLVEVTIAALLSLLIITALLTMFLRLTTDQRGILWRTIFVLAIFMGFFSLGVLTPWRGIFLTGGGVLLLGLFMVLYARRPIEPEPEPKPELVQDIEVVESAEQDIIEPNIEEPTELLSLPEITDQAPDDTAFHCPYCGRKLQDDFSFCPDCGRDSSQIHLCGNCGHEQLIPPETERVFCLNCGEPLS
jgi:hypothetical protein